MKTIHLPDDFPMADILVMLREHNLRLRFSGPGVYTATPTEPKPDKKTPPEAA